MPKTAKGRIIDVLENGQAAEWFGRMVAAQGGACRFRGALAGSAARRPRDARRCPATVTATSPPSTGGVLGEAGGATGRWSAAVRATGSIRRSGCRNWRGLGEGVSRGVPLCLVHAADDAAADAAVLAVQRAYRIGTSIPDEAPLIPEAGAMMARAFLIVMDSVGCGGAPMRPISAMPDRTLWGHIADECAAGRADDGRQGPLASLPVLDGLGAGGGDPAGQRGRLPPGLTATPRGRWGAATEVSLGKDTPSGHWELTGGAGALGLDLFSRHYPPPFPPIWWPRSAVWPGSTGYWGNCHASGTQIIDDLGGEHLRTGWPICYTSADSVFQIAAR